MQEKEQNKFGCKRKKNILLPHLLFNCHIEKNKDNDFLCKLCFLSLYLGPRPQSQGIFWGLIILSESFYDSGDYVRFVKIGASILDLWLDSFLGPSDPNVVFRLHTPNLSNFLRYHDFIEFTLWFWRKWGPVCENWS